MFELYLNSEAAPALRATKNRDYNQSFRGQKSHKIQEI